MISIAAVSNNNAIPKNQTDFNRAYAPNHRYDHIRSQMSKVTFTIPLIIVSDILPFIISILIIIHFTVSQSPVKNHIAVSNNAKFLNGV